MNLPFIAQLMFQLHPQLTRTSMVSARMMEGGGVELADTGPPVFSKIAYVYAVRGVRVAF